MVLTCDFLSKTNFLNKIIVEVEVNYMAIPMTVTPIVTATSDSDKIDIKFEVPDSNHEDEVPHYQCTQCHILKVVMTKMYICEEVVVLSTNLL